MDLGSNDEFVKTLERLFGTDPTEPGTTAYKFLNGSTDANGNRIANGIWDEVSRRFARETLGAVHVLLSPFKEFGVFEMSELPELLDNPNVTMIEGIPREQLALLAGAKGLTAVKQAITVTAYARIEMSGLLSGNHAAYLDFDSAEIAEVLKDDAKRAALFEKYNDPELKARLDRGIEALVDGGKIAHSHGVSKAFNRMGLIGGVLGFGFVAAQAALADTPEESERIVTDWAVDMVGGEIGSLIGGAVAGIALTAVGVATGPLTIALVLGAALVGGFYGAEAAADFYDTLQSRDEVARREILNRLTELYFGKDVSVSAEMVPDTESNFLMIDPALSPAAMAQAAKTSLGWRYALLKLNPFVVPLGPYEQLHNGNGELNRYDPATGKGLTDDYLLARAEALHSFVELFANGDKVSGGSVFPPGPDFHFLDAAMHGDPQAPGVELDLHYLSDALPQRLFGGDGSDVLRGGFADDALFGGAGDDALEGGTGADYLEGGAGHDSYFAGAGDRIFDHDGRGLVRFGDAVLYGAARDAGATEFVDGEGIRYTLSDGRLTVRRGSDTLLIDGFESGDLGIHLTEKPPVVDPGGATAVLGTANDDPRLQGGAGNDEIIGFQGNDWLSGEAGDDTLSGGDGADLLYGGDGADALYANDAASDIDAGAATGGQTVHDWLGGNAGDDRLAGSSGRDGLTGGRGDDSIRAGAGDDLIYGDAEIVVDNANWLRAGTDGSATIVYSVAVWEPPDAGNDLIEAGAGDDLVWGQAGDDRIFGGDGDDALMGDSVGEPRLAGALHGNDLIDGGEGADGIDGNGGSDTLLGGGGDDRLDGDFRVVRDDDALYMGGDLLDGGSGNDTLVGNGGGDTLLGGEGADALFGDLAGLDAAYHGGDVLYGGAGTDQLVGQGGNDTLHGGDGADRLYGDDVDLFQDRGDDVLFGGEGQDQLSGGLGHDVLAGGSGDDSLWGDSGNDRLAGGGGLDYLDGGAGADTYVFSHGDSPVIDGVAEGITDLAGEGNRILFTRSIDRSGLAVEATSLDDDLVLHYGDDDVLHIAGGLTGAIDDFVFGDSSPVTYQALWAALMPGVQYLSGGAGDDRVLGGLGDDGLDGAAGHDTLHGGRGNDTLSGGDGNDVLIGGAGDDRMDGGMGLNVFVLKTGHGRDRIGDTAGYDLVWFPDLAFSALTFSEQGADLLITHGSDSLTLENWRASSVGQIVFEDNRVLAIGQALDPHPTLGIAVSGIDAVDGVIDGTEGGDDIGAARDNVLLRGGAGDDTYRLTAGPQGVVIEDAEGENTLVVSGDPQAQVYLNRDGNDLVVVLDGAELARWRDGADKVPARLVLPDGQALSGALLDARLNAAPLAGAGIAPLQTDEDAPFTWRVPDEVLTDPDGEPLTLSAGLADGRPLPGWLSFDATSHAFSGTPRNADVGDLELVINARDRGGLEAQARVSLQVVNTNDAPHVVADPGERIAVGGRVFSLDLANEVFADVDVGDTLHFGALLADGSPLPAWLQFDPDTGLLTGIPPTGEPGVLSFVITATDPAGASASTGLSLDVREDDDVLTVQTTTLGPTGQLQVYEIASAGDVDGDGFEDLLVVSEPTDLSGWLSDAAEVRRAAYLLHGQAGGWGATPDRVTTLYEYAPEDVVYDDPAISHTRPEAPVFDLHNKVVVKPLGDLDGDGYADLGYTAVDGGLRQFRVLYGGTSGWGGALDLAAGGQLVSTIDLPTTGVYVRLADTLDWNGDGRQDLLFQTAGADYDPDSSYGSALIPNTGTEVRMYFDIGRWKGQSLDADTLASQADLRLYDSAGGSIQSVRAVGDLDGDGRGDLAVFSAPGTTDYSDMATARILYGDPALSGTVDIAALGTGQISRIDFLDGPKATLQPLGDVNGDAIDDLLVASGAGLPATVLFGDSSRPADIGLPAGTGDDGFVVADRAYGPSLSVFDIDSGDLNGDGIHDIVLGSSTGTFVDPNPSVYGTPLEATARAEVIYGRQGGFDGVVDPSALDEAAGFAFEVPYLYRPPGDLYPAPPPAAGLPGIGQVALLDIDGDGIRDLVKAAVDLDGTTGTAGSVVETLYGRATDGGGLTGTDGDDVLVINGEGTVFTHAGDDVVTVHVGSGLVSLDTGEGNDDVRLLLPADGGASLGARTEVNGGGGDDRIEVVIPAGISGIQLPAQGIVLRGGAGADSYVVTGRGVAGGAIHIDDRSSSGQGNSLVLGGGYAASQLRLGLGSLKLGFVGDGLEIHLENFDSGNVLAGPRDIEVLRFEDGTELSYEALVGRGFDLEGTVGADSMAGTSVTDRLSGYAGDDTLLGGDGDDRLDGGAGDDLLDGGSGDDRFVVAPGDGHDTLLGGGGADIVAFAAGIDPSALQVVRNDDDLLVGYTPGGDAVLVRDWFLADDHRMARFEFADGTHLSSGDIEWLVWQAQSTITGTAGSDRLRGTDGRDLIDSGAGHDRLYGGAGDDRLYAGAGDDVLRGQAGDDSLIGGDGDDRYHVDSPNDVVVEAFGAGHDRVWSTVDFVLPVHVEDLKLRDTAVNGQGNAQDNRITGNGYDNTLVGAPGDDRLQGGEGNDRLQGDEGDDSLSGDEGDDTLQGGSGDDRLRGGAGADFLAGGAGDDVLDGGAGSDQYRFGRGDGVDRIREASDDVSSADSDTLQFDADILPEQLWFSRAGNRLVAQLIGSADQVSVQRWFADTPERLETLVAGEGERLTAERVDQLVNAVAAFDVQAAPVIELSATQQEEYKALVATHWERPAAAAM